MLLCSVLLALASWAPAPAAAPSVETCVGLLDGAAAGAGEAGVSSKELCTVFSEALEQTRGWAGGLDPPTGLLANLDVLIALRALLSTPSARRLSGGVAEGGVGAVGEVLQALSSDEAAHVETERLFRSLLSAGATRTLVTQALTIALRSASATIREAAGHGGSARYEALHQSADVMADVLLSRAAADQVVSLVRAVAGADGLSEAVTAAAAEPSAGGWFGGAASTKAEGQAAIGRALLSSPGVVEALISTLTCAPLRQMVALGCRGSGLLDEIARRDDLPDHEQVLALATSDQLAALAGALLRAPALREGALLAMDGKLTEAEQSRLQTELLQTRPIFRAVADVLRTDAAAAVVSEGVDPLLKELEVEDSTGVGVLRSVLKSRFMLNRVAGLIESTPLGADIALLWLREGSSAVDNLAETAALLAKATGGAALEAASDLAGAAGSAASSAWGAFSSWASGNGKEL